MDGPSADGADGPPSAAADGPSAQPSDGPGEARPGDAVAPPRLVAWEVTRSCNLACAHCRASAVHGPYPNELTTDEAFTLVDQIASFANPILILTGGDPLMRERRLRHRRARHSTGVARRHVAERHAGHPRGGAPHEGRRHRPHQHLGRLPDGRRARRVPRRARRLRGRDAWHPDGDRGRRRGPDQLHDHQAQRPPPARAARARRARRRRELPPVHAGPDRARQGARGAGVAAGGLRGRAQLDVRRAARLRPLPQADRRAALLARDAPARRRGPEEGEGRGRRTRRPSWRASPRRRPPQRRVGHRTSKRCARPVPIPTPSSLPTRTPTAA